MNIRDGLKTFYVGDRQGTAIYIGSTKVWPINPCNPQIVTVANPVPQGTTIVDPCSYVFSSYDGTINDIQRDWMGRGSGLTSTVISFTADLSELALNIDGVPLCSIMGSAQTYADVKLNSGDLSRKGGFFKTSHFDLNNQEITNLNEAYGRWYSESQFLGQTIHRATLSNVKIPTTTKEVSANYLFIGVEIDNNDFSVMNNFQNLVLVDPKWAFAETADGATNIDNITINIPFKGDCNHMFHRALYLTTIPSNFTFTGITDISYMFSTCSRLTATPEIDCHLVTDCTSFAANCPELVTVGALNGLGESLTKGGVLYFAQSPNLSTDSLQNIAESIGTAVSSNTSISFKSTAYDKLTDEQKSLIASKNWSINRVA